MNSSLIAVDVAVRDRIAAVRAAGKLLLEAGYIEPQYTEAMIRTMEEMGPYIVITKGIAMPHARPEEGAKKSGFCIVRLKDPVAFGNEENDPVRLVFGLSAKNGAEHIKVIQTMMELLEEEENLKILFEGTKEEIVELLEEKR